MEEEADSHNRTCSHLSMAWREQDADGNKDVHDENGQENGTDRLDLTMLPNRPRWQTEAYLSKGDDEPITLDDNNGERHLQYGRAEKCVERSSDSLVCPSYSFLEEIKEERAKRRFSNGRKLLTDLSALERLWQMDYDEFSTL